MRWMCRLLASDSGCEQLDLGTVIKASHAAFSSFRQHAFCNVRKALDNICSEFLNIERIVILERNIGYRKSKNTNMKSLVSAVLVRKKVSIVWSIGPNAMVIDAIQLMGQKNVGALPVVDNGTLVGIISERDYTRKVILKGMSSKETPVSDIMTAQVLTVTPSESVIECMRIMTEKHVRHLPVLEGTNLVGMLSIGDMVNWFISAQTATIDNLERYIGWR